MTRDEAQGVITSLLLEKVREDKYPSVTQLDLIEAAIPQAMLSDYVEVLVEKIAQDTYPSLPMIRRLQRVAQRLPRQEEQQEG
jgi:hypothetical protein